MSQLHCLISHTAHGVSLHLLSDLVSIVVELVARSLDFGVGVIAEKSISKIYSAEFKTFTGFSD